MSFEVPAGGIGSAGFTCTGLGYDGTNLLIGDYTNSRIVQATTAGAYVGEVILASAPANSVQGVTFDTSDSTYWVCHYAVGGGSLRHYSAAGALLDTITLSGIAVNGPNGNAYDAANDRVLTCWDDGTIRAFSCATLSTTPVETIVTGLSNTDGVALDVTTPTTRLWITVDDSGTTPATLRKINRSTGATVETKQMPADVESIYMVDATTIYMACDQLFHTSVTNGNRVWVFDPTTGEEKTGVTVGAKLIAFDLAAATGDQIITGVGFAPKVVLLFGMFSGDGATMGNHFGAFDFQYRMWASSDRDNDAVSPSQSDCYWSSAYAYAGLGSTATADFLATPWSVTHDGWVWNATIGAVGTRRIMALCLYGDDLDAFVGNFDLTTSAGTQAVTGVGFTPKAVLFSMNLSSTTPGVVATGRMSVGAMTSSAQWCAAHSGFDLNNPTDEQSGAVTDGVLLRVQNTLTYTAKASYSSLDADGFTLTKGTPPGVNIRTGYVALGGNARFAAGAFNQPTTTGAQSVTGVGFQPLAELFVSAGKASNASPTANTQFMIGAARTSSERAVYVGSAEDAVVTANTARGQSEAACLLAISNGGTPTRLALADFTSQNADGFTVNWTTADATARQNFYLAVGMGASSSGAGVSQARGRYMRSR